MDDKTTFQSMDTGQPQIPDDFSFDTTRREQGRFEEFDPLDLKRKQEVCVLPEEYLELVKKDSDKRLFIVGADNEECEGATTVAVRLAVEIAASQDSNLSKNIFRTDFSRINRLADIFTSEFGKGIYIFKRALERGVQLDDLRESGRLNDIVQELKNKESFLIVTVYGRRYTAISGASYMPVNDVDLSEVFDRHLDYHFGDDLAIEQDDYRLKRESIKSFKDRLTNPKYLSASQIGEIFRLLDETKVDQHGSLLGGNRDDPEVLQQAIVELLDQFYNDVTNINRLQARFFESLNFNERLMGMLAALLLDPRFKAKPYLEHDLEELYYLTINHLRRNTGMAKEGGFEDARLFGTQDLLHKLGIDVEDGMIRFSDRQIYTNFARQIPNYHRLLWVLSEVLDNLNNRRVPDYFHQLPPSDIARLIGQFGVYRRNRLLSYVRTLVDNNRAGFASNLLLPLVFFPEEIISDSVSASKNRQVPLVQQILSEWLPNTKNSRTSDITQYKMRYRAAVYTIAQMYVEIYDLMDTDDDAEEQYRRAKTLFDNQLRQLAENVGQCHGFVERETKEISKQYSRIYSQQKKGTPASTRHKRARERTHKARLGLAQRVIEATSQNINDLRDSIDFICNQSAGREDLIQLVTNWIETGIASAEMQLSEQKEHDPVFEKLQEFESPTAKIGDASLDVSQIFQQQKQNRYITDNILFHVGVMIANHWFIQSAGRQQTRTELINLARQLVANDHEESPEVVEKQLEDVSEQLSAIEDTEEAEISEQEDASVVDKTSDALEKENEQLNDDTVTETKYSESVESAAQQPQDTSREEVPKGPEESEIASNSDNGEGVDADVYDEADRVIDDENIMGNASAEEIEENNLSLENEDEDGEEDEADTFEQITWITIQDDIDSLLPLLPAMLSASVYNLGDRELVTKLPQGEMLATLYGHREGLHFSQSNSLALSTPPIFVALSVTKTWYESISKLYDGDTRADRLEQWRKKVYPALLSLVNHASSQSRHLIREGLFGLGWITSEHRMIREIAHALVARCYILDGTVLDLPNSGRRGFLLLETSRRPWDGSQQRKVYYEQAIRLLNRLSLLTSIEVLYLGSNKKSQTVGVEPGESHLSASDLLLREERSRIMFPLFDRTNGATRITDPHDTHFVLVYAPIHYSASEADPGMPILDLDDLVDVAAQDSPSAASFEDWDPFAESSEVEATQPAAHAWNWQQKFILLTSDRARLIQQLQATLTSQMRESRPIMIDTSAEDLFQIVTVGRNNFDNSTANLIQVLVRRGVISTLFEQTPEQWMQELLSYRQDFFPDDPTAISTFEDIRDNLPEWISKLDSVEQSGHPRDVTLTIAWIVLAISRTDLGSIVKKQSDDSDVEDTPGRFPHKFNIVTWLSSEETTQQIVGVAMTKLLFNFYDEVIEQIDAKNYHPLVRLLEPFLECEHTTFEEYVILLDKVVSWAKEPAWAKYFLGDEDLEDDEDKETHAAFVSIVDNIRSRYERQRIMDLFQYYETQAYLTILCNKLNLPFRVILLVVAELVKVRETDRQDAYVALADKLNRILRAAELDQSVSASQLEKLDNIVRRPIFQSRTRQYLTYLESRDQRLRDPAHHNSYEKSYRSISDVTASVRLKLYGRSEDQMPTLPKNRRYGVLLINVSSSEVMVPTALYFLRQFQQEQRNDSIKTLISVHRIGRQETVFQGTRGGPHRQDLRLVEEKMVPLLIGPVLDRYPVESVGFVLVMTEEAIVDLDDWEEQAEWHHKFWIHTTTRSDILANRLDRSTQDKKPTKKDVETLVREVREKLSEWE